MSGYGFREDIADRLSLPAEAAGLMKVTVMGRSLSLIHISSQPNCARWA